MSETVWSSVLFGMAMSEASACHEKGMVWPIVNRDRCLGDADCVAACPNGILAVAIVVEHALDAGWSGSPALPVIRRQAHVVAPERCAACGLCVTACAQRSIILQGRYEDPVHSRRRSLKI
ncbi:4Fe-4S dicluster domain-containing protein [Dokdonella ginsengisoli]|uniref:Ferredoxin family protein n=1 Tax=Dokdonella ginsengisoli TaxID=363846 RepID=A0ABV9QQG2_9GAMM